MQNSEIKIFYSWQSDLPASETRNLIQDGIKDAVRLLRDTVEIDADRDTRGEYGSPDIVQTIFSKIDDSDIFIADVSGVCEYHPYNNDRTISDTTKISPNPNVLIELGYAANVLGWENIICILNTDYGDPSKMPFDIAHRRLTPYSLQKKTKGEVKRQIRDIIQETIVHILENGKRAKKQFSNIQVGGYKFDAETFEKSLVPYDLKESTIWIETKENALNQCRRWIDEIAALECLASKQETKKNVEQEETPEPIIRSDGSILTPVKSSFKLFEERVVEISEEYRENISYFANHYLGIDINANKGFFNLGNLRSIPSPNAALLGQLIGTDIEKEKHRKILELACRLHSIHIWENYMKTFDGLLLLPLTVMNDSVITDENITVIINIDTDTAEIIFPTEDLLASECDGIEEIIMEEAIPKKLLMMPENSKIQYETDISYSINDIRFDVFDIRGINGVPKYNRTDYANELAKYIAIPLENGIDFSFTIDSLRAKEMKWIGPAILVKPLAKEVVLSYTIKSNNSDGSLAGLLTYKVER